VRSSYCITASPWLELVLTPAATDAAEFGQAKKDGFVLLGAQMKLGSSILQENFSGQNEGRRK
jgi:hypothetical protein